MNKDHLRESQLADFINKLPFMPSNLDKLVDAKDDPDRQDQLVDLIKHDPGLCADVLHIANTMTVQSPHIETIQQALSRVGLGYLIEQLVEIAEQEGPFRAEMVCSQCLKQYYHHSRQVALACGLLAQTARLNQKQAEIYELAGLIHDIGRLIIMLASDKRITPLVGSSIEQIKSITDDEKQLLGMDHCQIGAMVCRKWGFSETLIDGILQHHRPISPNHFSKAGAFIFAAHFLLDGTKNSAAMLPSIILHKLSICRDDFNALAVTINTPDNQ